MGTEQTHGGEGNERNQYGQHKLSIFYLSFSVVFPLFCMMALGYFLKLINMFDEDFLRRLNKVCFRVFLPLILFINVYTSDFNEAFSPRLIIFASASIIICFSALILIIPGFQKDKKKCGVMIQGMFRSNYILFGIPVATSLFGEGSASVTAILISVIVPLFNVFSVIILESYSEKKTPAIDIVKSILTNPLIVAAVIAFAFVLTGIRLPGIMEKTISDISKVATPLALIVLGGTFSFFGLNHAAKALTFSVIGKLIIVPAIFLPISILLGFRGMELAALFAMYASPTAVSSFTMAESMGSDGKLAGQIVVVSSIFSILTIFIGLTILIHWGFI